MSLKIRYRLNKAIKLLDIYFTVFKYKFFYIKKNNLSTYEKKLSKSLDYNSDQERSIQEIDFPNYFKNVVITCYFIMKKDPQHGNTLNEPDINYIKPWYNSMLNNNLNGIIIHDELPQDFISKHETDNIKFIKYISGNYSIFEERWIAYYLLLLFNDFDNIFFTDSNDVQITTNPFEKHNHKNILYIGRDAANRFIDSEWVLQELNKFERDSNISAPKSLKLQPLYNAGIVGGDKNLILNLIHEIIEMTFLSKTDDHKDMTLLNWAIHKLLKPDLCLDYNPNKLVNPSNDFAKNHSIIFTGFPLNSMFKKYEINSKATFIHK